MLSRDILKVNWDPINDIPRCPPVWISGSTVLPFSGLLHRRKQCSQEIPQEHDQASEALPYSISVSYSEQVISIGEPPPWKFQESEYVFGTSIHILIFDKHFKKLHGTLSFLQYYFFVGAGSNGPGCSGEWMPDLSSSNKWKWQVFQPFSTIIWGDSIILNIERPLLFHPHLSR